MKKIEYIDGLKNNNSTIIQKIYEEYFPLIEAFILKNQGKKHEVKGVFQEGLILVFKKSKQPNFELTSKFSTFLYGCCRNVWRNELRKKYREEITIVDTMTYIDEYSIEEDLHKKAQIELYKEKFEELGANCQELLQLFFSKKSYKEIIQTMNNYSTENSAKKQKHNCVQQLIKKIQNDDRYEELKDNY